jgi:hypothetical protein
VRTDKPLSNLVKLSDIRRERERALSPYGPVRAGLTTSQRTNEEVRLMELLNSLESVVESLNFKSFTVYDTLNTAIEAVRVALLHTTADEAGTSETP